MKQRYAKGITNVMPMPANILRRCEFRADLSPGASSEFDVQLAPELGFSQGTGMYQLSGAIAQVSKRASVTPYGLTLQSQVSYDVITRAEGSDRAFESFSSNKFIPMVESFRMREEYHALLGRDQGIGKVTNNSSGVLTISADTWIPALAATLVGAVLEAYDAKLTATTAAGSQHDGDLTVTGVNLANRTITVSGTNTAVVNGDYLYFKGDYTTTSRIGLVAIGRNTGTLFGIDASLYPLWAGNTFDVGTSAISLGKILQMAAKAGEKGSVGIKLVCEVPVSAFQSLVSDEAALKSHGATKKAQNGFETLEFLGGTGPIEVVPHLFMPDGMAVMWAPDYTYILGSTEATTKVGKDGDLMHEVPNYNGREMRMFSDTCGVFSERPGFIVIATRSDGNKLSA
ncbi:MAG TPA: hypothetical protein V6C65_26140 [Allocoleopsis sp.]